MSALELQIRREISRVGEQAIADKVGRNISSVSKWLSGSTGIPIEMIESLLDALGFSVVPSGYVVIEAKEHDALVELAALWINSKSRRA